MASLWRHPQSKYWTACFTDRDGRRRKRSTKTTDRKLAMKLAEQYEQAARRRRTARQVREVIVSLHREIANEELRSMSVQEFVAGWLERKQHEVAPATLAYYKGVAAKFQKFLGADAEREIVEIGSEYIVQFRNTLAKTLSPRTTNHTLKGVRMIFKSARQDNVISEDPTEFVETVRQPKEEGGRRAFTIPEVQAILVVADAEWSSLIKCGVYLGQRLADLATLVWKNIDLDRAEVRITTRKTGRKMIMPIAPALRTHLASLPAGQGETCPCIRVLLLL